MSGQPLLIFAAKAVGILAVVLTAATYATWAERRVAAWIQDRIGPNKTGPFGLLQPIADVLKLFFKEEIVPAPVDPVLHFITPGIIMVGVIAATALIPFAENLTLADPPVGVLLLLGISALSGYSVILAGMASRTKYSLFGSLRAAAQVISYEIPMALAIASVVLMAGSLSLVDIVKAQSHLPFAITQPVAFIIYLIAVFAETNRAPFDLPEAESELVGGYHTEYSSMRFAWFFAGEYAHVVIASALITTFFLGGWYGPGPDGVWWFAIKTLFFVYFFLWVRWTYPRTRYDQLMKFAWKVLIPLGLLNILVTALIKIWG